MDVEAFQAALERELTAGHPLFGIPVRAIARRWDDVHVLFAFEDGTSRLAEVHLRWRGEPWEIAHGYAGPVHSVYTTFEEWFRHAELINALARFRSTKALNPQFKPGDKVLLLRGGEWEFDASATITSEGRTVMIHDATIHVEYTIEFDEPQRSLGDRGEEADLRYTETPALEIQLRSLSQPNQT